MNEIEKLLEGLTPEEKALLCKDLVRMRCKTREDLHNWGKFFMNVDLADCTVSRFADSNPLDMVWEIYQLCADDHREEPVSLMYIAGRASQKTLAVAVLQVILPLHFGRAVVHLGGTKDQARRAYLYFKKFVSRPYLRDFLLSDPTQSKTTFVVDGEEVDVEILSISPMAVQGSHAPIVSLDELSSLSKEKMAAYQDVGGIPVYTNDGKPWFQFGISSRKGRYTVIETEYENREKSGMLFRFWTILENTKRCPDSISGTEPFTYYVNAKENIKMTQEEFNKTDESTQSKMERINAYKGCFSCPLAAVCAGDLKKQTSTCRTLRPTQSVIAEFKKADLSWFLSQKMSMEPSSEGLIFAKFKRVVFEKTPREMYRIFTGTDPGRELAESELVNFMIQKGVKRYAGLDHGSTHPAVVVVIYEDGNGIIYIMNVTAQAELEPEQLKELVFSMKKKYDFHTLYPDTSRPELNKMLRKVVKVFDDFDKSGQIENGITLIRQKLYSTGGTTAFFGIKGNCDFMCSEMEKYHYDHDAGGKLTDVPVDEFNHSIDALRYAAINRWKTRTGGVAASTAGQVDEKPKEDPKQYQQAVAKKQENWLSDQIRQSVETGGGGEGLQTSKSKTNYWDI